MAYFSLNINLVNGGQGHGARTRATLAYLGRATESAEQRHKHRATQRGAQTEKANTNRCAAAQRQGTGPQHKKRKAATCAAGAKGGTQTRNKKRPCRAGTRESPRGAQRNQRGSRGSKRESAARRRKATTPPRGAAQPRGARPRGPAG